MGSATRTYVRGDSVGRPERVSYYDGTGSWSGTWPANCATVCLTVQNAAQCADTGSKYIALVLVFGVQRPLNWATDSLRLSRSASAANLYVWADVEVGFGSQYGVLVLLYPGRQIPR